MEWQGVQYDPVWWVLLTERWHGLDRTGFFQNSMSFTSQTANICQTSVIALHQKFSTSRCTNTELLASAWHAIFFPTDDSFIGNERLKIPKQYLWPLWPFLELTIRTSDSENNSEQICTSNFCLRPMLFHVNPRPINCYFKTQNSFKTI